MDDAPKINPTVAGDNATARNGGSVGKKGHMDCEYIASRLAGASCLWQQRVKNVGMISTYATQSGLVVFLDFTKGGWTMLTECPSLSPGEHDAELDSMLTGDARARFVRSEDVDTLDVALDNAADTLGPRGYTNAKDALARIVRTGR